MIIRRHLFQSLWRSYLQLLAAIMIGPRSPGAGTPHPRNGDDSLGGPGGSTSLHHQTSAKHLIARYESLTTPPPRDRSPPTFLNHAKSLRWREQRSKTQSGHMDSNYGLTQPPPVGLSSKKDRSPLRQSFRNLFSVLKKGTNGLPGAVKKRLSEDKLGFTNKLRASIDKDDLDEGLKVDPILESPDIDNPLDTPLRQKKRQTGPLLYLTYPPEGNNLPHWIPADVTLDALYVSVSMFLTEMDLFVREIALVDCVDIRSVSLPQLGVEEAQALDEIGGNDGGGDGLRVFEMLLKGGKKERFAARSVKERAGWISSIWDATLPAHKLKAAQERKLKEATSVVERPPTHSSKPVAVEESQVIPIESPMPTPLMKSSSLLSPSYSDRSLPPLPPASPPPPLHLSVPESAPLVKNLLQTGKTGAPNRTTPPSEGPISPSIYPPTMYSDNQSNNSQEQSHPQPPALRVKTTSLSRTGERPASSLSSPITPRSAPHSPSIQNLSQLSMVRQRLAQIERSHSELSTQTLSGLASGASTPVRARSPLSPVTPTRNRIPLKSPTTPGTLPTPTGMVSSPVSPTGSTWSMGTAVFHNKAKGTSEGTATNHKEVPLDRLKSNDEAGYDRKPHSKGATPVALPPIEPLKVDRKAKEKEEMVLRNVGKPEEDPITKVEKSIERILVAEDQPAWTEEMDKISKDLNGLKSVVGGESGYPTIHQMVVGLEHYAHAGKKSLKGVKETMEDVKQRMEEVATHAASTSAVTMENGAKILQRLEEQHQQHLKALSQSQTHIQSTTVQATAPGNGEVLRALDAIQSRLASDFPTLLQTLKEIQLKESDNKKALDEGAGSDIASAKGAGNTALVESAESKVDLIPLFQRLEEIKGLCEEQKQQAARSPANDAGAAQELKLPELERILALVEEEGQKQALLSQQQADSVRYLNELNSWLEAFVNNGTSQIQGLAANVEQISKALGCLTPDYAQDPRIPGASLPDPDGPKNLMSDIRELISGMQARDQNFAALQAAVHSLLEVLTMSQSQIGNDSRAIAGMIDQQRRDQETLFRAFTDEISGEIKGERLRFVEAMKEATAINVQLHVEQFKHELNREVMSMTEEVGRLHREKQTVEQQISELFSFYSKQKQMTMVLVFIQI
ncbi:hypothetical protein BJ165DRAFT_984467 [Panaeolus papilionaceus]|nr:hypothetical protein BJ165DRAFT_984467 [Panaeolus papilionaceus]